MVEEDGHTAPRLLLALLVSGLLGVGATGCSEARKAPSSSSASSAVASAGREVNTTITTNLVPPGQRFRGDGDADNPSDLDGNGDADPDPDNDNPTPESYHFPDRDDEVAFATGHRASISDTRALTSTVRRYYAAARGADGMAACALLVPSIAHAVPEDIGSAAGSSAPSYLRSGKTCPAVMSMLFEHDRQELAEAIDVIEVRVAGDRAWVMIGSKAMRASQTQLERRGGRWWIDQLLGLPLP